MHGIKTDVMDEMKKLFPYEIGKLLKTIDQQESEICDLQELVVKYSNGIFGDDLTANCGQCKNYVLQVGPEDNSDWCSHYMDSSTICDLVEFEECEGFEKKEETE